MFKISIFVLAFVVGAVVSWTEQECQQSFIYYLCPETFGRKYEAATTDLQTCQAILEYVSCEEEIACDCNLTISYEYNSALTYIHHQYEKRGCEELQTGELPDSNGIPCDKFDQAINETHGGLIDMQFSASELLLALDKNCSGVTACYATYDSEGGLAVYNRNMSELCLSLDRLIICLDNAVCACNGENSTDVVRQILIEDYYYRESCGYVNVPGHEMVPRLDVRCHTNGTVKTRTVCDAPDPTFKCFLQYGYSLGNYPEDVPLNVLCPAMKVYIECVEAVACECGLLVDQVIFFDLTSSIDYYNRSGCMKYSAPIEVIPGLNCPDGSKSTDVADRIALEFSKHPYIEMQEKWCQGVKQCYANFDEAAAVPLFEKNNFQLCIVNRLWVECLELAFCDCGFYDYENTTYELANIRKDHEFSCHEDVVLKTDFKCMYGTIGFKCSDNSDCKLVPDSECTDSDECGCKPNYKFRPSNMTCMPAVSGATLPEGKSLTYLMSLVSVVVLLGELKK